MIIIISEHARNAYSINIDSNISGIEYSEQENQNGK